MLRLFILMVLVTGKISCLLYETSKFTVVSTTNTPQLRNKQQNITVLENKIATIESQLLKIQTICTDNSNVLNDLKVQSSEQHLPRNCKEVQTRGYNTSNVYFIQPKSAPKPILAPCNMETKGGGWTTIVNRFDGSQDFFQSWHYYIIGFGTLRGEFWLGLDNIHYLTEHQVNELLVELVDWDLKKVYAHYSSFVVGDRSEGYIVKVLDGYSGTAGNSLTMEVNRKFSTIGRTADDSWGGGSCANFFKGGWWYHDCNNAHPTGMYLGRNLSEKDAYVGMFWKTFHGEKYSLRELKMMVRPRDY